MFSSAYLLFCIHEDFNIMLFSLLLLFICVMCVQSNSIFFFFWFSVGFCWVILHSSWFVILSIHFIFIIHLMHLFTNICNVLVICLAVFPVPQVYNDTDLTFVLNILILALLMCCGFSTQDTAEQIHHLLS